MTLRSRSAPPLTLAALVAWAALVLAGPVAAQASVVRPEPGTAPVAPGAPPSPATGAPPVLAWAALGLAAAAALLGGAALTLAVRARRDVAGSSAVEPRTAERLDHLEAAVRELTAAARRSAAASSREVRAPFPPQPGPAREAAPDPPRFPPPAPPPAREAAATVPSAVTPAGGDDLAAWSAELTVAFARLARDPSGAADGFIARHHPRGVAAGPDGIAFVDAFEGAKLWAVRAPGEGEVWALTPGEQAAVNWSAHFAPQRREVAAEVFGAAFDLLDGGGEALRMEAPAFVRRDASGRLSVRRRGRLAGFRG